MQGSGMKDQTHGLSTLPRLFFQTVAFFGEAYADPGQFALVYHRDFEEVYEAVSWGRPVGLNSTDIMAVLP